MSKDQEREILERKALREWFTKAGLGNSIVELGSIEDGSLTFILTEPGKPADEKQQHQGTTVKNRVPSA